MLYMSSKKSLKVYGHLIFCKKFPIQTDKMQIFRGQLFGKF